MHPPASLWWSTLGEDVVARPALKTNIDVDVAIVGGGFTGLWTARELLRRDPSLQIALLEQSVCGFGASGRNGGWASALYPQSATTVIAREGRASYDHLRVMLHRAVDELGVAAADDGIDAHYHRGGTLTFARSTQQAARLSRAVRDEHDLGATDSDVTWLDEQQARRRGGVSAVFGARFTPYCARIHPARLARGLATDLASRGVLIFEETKVTRIDPASRNRRACAVSVGGTVRADVIVRATEGFTPTFAHQRRTIAPIFSLMIATEPLPSSFWDEVGFRDYETFADDRHLIVYGQRTADDRIAFGGRGAPYHFGSTVEPRFDEDTRAFTLIESTLRELFPSLRSSITHRWGGPLAMPRDLSPSVVVDYASGLASAGGYTGDGVVLSRVAANALADLITAPDETTEFTTLPFVQHRGRRWEPEPLRWLGINTGLVLASWADRHEARRDGESRASRLLDRLLG